MLFRLVALAVFLVSLGALRAQQALPPEGTQVLKSSPSAEAAPDTAWLDLRQNSPTHSKIQAAPSWVESISFAPAKVETERVNDLRPKAVLGNRLRTCRRRDQPQVESGEFVADLGQCTREDSCVPRHARQSRRVERDQRDAKRHVSRPTPCVESYGRP